MPVKVNRIVRVIVITLITIATVVFLYLLINNFQFFRGVTVRVHFNSIGDLNTGAWVRKAGMKVGSVTRLEPAEDEKTVIATLTFRPGEMVRVGDKFSLVSKGILGDMYIEEVPGPKDSEPVEPGHLFEGEPFLSLNDILGGTGMDIIGDVSSSIKAIGDILTKNQQILDATIKDIQKTAANAVAISENVVELTKTVPVITAQIVSSMDRLEKTVNDFSDAAEGVIDKLQGSLVSGSDDLAASLKSIRKASEEIQTMADRLAAKSSVIGTLSSAETARSVSSTLKNLEDMSRTLLKATEDTQKIVEGVRTILEPQ